MATRISTQQAQGNLLELRGLCTVAFRRARAGKAEDSLMGARVENPGVTELKECALVIVCLSKRLAESDAIGCEPTTHLNGAGQMPACRLGITIAQAVSPDRYQPSG